MSNPKNFEDFLKDTHTEDYHGTDDDMPDAFDNWLAELDVELLVAYGDRYGTVCKLQKIEEFKKLK